MDVSFSYESMASVRGKNCPLMTNIHWEISGVGVNTGVIYYKAPKARELHCEIKIDKWVMPTLFFKPICIIGKQ